MRPIPFGINHTEKLTVIVKGTSECKSQSLKQDVKALLWLTRAHWACYQDRGIQGAGCTLTCFPKREVIFGVVHSQDRVVVGG